MKPTITLAFDSLAEMEEFMASMSAKVASAQLSPEPAPADPAPAPVETAEVVPMTPAVDPLAGAEPEAAEEPAEEAPAFDAQTLRADLMARLRALANKEGVDAAAIGAFINSFKVQRFSELADDQLMLFKTALDAEFGAE